MTRRRTKPQRPTPGQTAVLRAIAGRGGLVVTMTGGRPVCTYADGVAPSRAFDLGRFVRAHWIVPAEGCAPLFGEAWALRYVVPRRRP